MDEKQLKEYELSVIAPCFNEAENINALVNRVQTVFTNKNINGEIVLVNDFSTDNTGEIINELAQKYNNITAIHNKRNLGMAKSWKVALDSSCGKYVCIIDSDLQYLPEDISRLYSEIKMVSADIIQGYRSTIGRSKDNRFIYSVVLNWMLNTLFGMNLKDNKSGFVVARKKTLEDTFQHRFKYYYFNTFITVAAHSKGYTVKEIETLFENRNLGKSYIKSFPFSLIFKVMVDLIKGFFEYRLLSQIHDVHYHFLAKHSPIRAVEGYKGWRKLLFDTFFATMPLHKWMISSDTKNYYKYLKQTEWLSAKDLKNLQEIKLQRLMHHVYNHVPYYRNLFKSLNLQPDDITSIADLEKIPLLSKDDVRNNLYFDLFSDIHKKNEMLKIATSGSTGEPFVTFADKKQLEIRWATTLRAAEWTGWRFGDKQVRLWHQTIGMSPVQVFKEKLDAFFMRRLFIPAYELSDKNIIKFLKKIKRHNPVLIDGYAESFNLLSHYLRNNNIKGISPKAIMSSAQILPEQVRDLIQENFKTKVYDKYGSREFSGIAYECEHQSGHHIMSESYIVEILKDGIPAKPGEIGEVVITDLNNFSVPLIRYRIGDLATAMDETIPCECGRNLPRIGRIEGRAQAVVLCENNTWLPGTFFAHFFKEYDYAIAQYQIVQNEKKSITLKIIPEKQYNQQIKENIIDNLKVYTGKSMEINVEETDFIPMTKTGKRTSIVSNLEFDFQFLEN